MCVFNPEGKLYLQDIYTNPGPPMVLKTGRATRKCSALCRRTQQLGYIDREEWMHKVVRSLFIESFEHEPSALLEWVQSTDISLGDVVMVQAPEQQLEALAEVEEHCGPDPYQVRCRLLEAPRPMPKRLRSMRLCPLPEGIIGETRSVGDKHVQTIESTLGRPLERLADDRSPGGTFVSENCIHCRPSGNWSATAWAEGFPIGARVHCRCGIVLYIEKHHIRAMR